MFLYQYHIHASVVHPQRQREREREREGDGKVREHNTNSYALAPTYIMQLDDCTDTKPTNIIIVPGANMGFGFVGEYVYPLLRITPPRF